MFIVAATPRSGTAYASKVFRSAGIDVGHEVYGMDGISSWLHLYDIDYIPWLSKPSVAQKYDAILHQVRDPLKSVSSMMTSSKPAVDIMRSIAGDPEAKHNKSELSLIMHFWFAMNEMINGRADYWYRVEDMEESWPKILKVIGQKDRPFPLVEKNVNGREHAVLTWKNLRMENRFLHGQMLRKAERYGYQNDQSKHNFRGG